MISIIVPVYKAEERIRLCIESVLAQTYEDFELILVDDGSPDKSGEICDEFATKDKRVAVIHKENGGASDARNFGIERAKGEYITFLDSDDNWDKGFLSNALDKIGTADIYISGIKMYGGDTDSLFIPSFSGVLGICELYEKVFFGIPLICVSGPCCKLFKREIITGNKLKFSPFLRCGEDTDFNLSYMRCAQKAYVDNASFYNYYRGDQNSLFSSYNPQYYSDHVHVYEKWLQLITDLGCSQETIMYFKQVYLNALIGNIHAAFLHNRSKEEKKSIINILSTDKIICSCDKIQGKNKIIKWLLKNKFKWLVYCIFYMHYKKKS